MSNVRRRVSQRAFPLSLSACLRSWATPQRAVRPASLAASARAVVLGASSLPASARAARPLASGALPEFLVARVRSSVLAGREACWGRSFHSRSHAVTSLTRRAALRGTEPVRSRSPLAYPVSSVSATKATQRTAVFGGVVGVGVCSVGLSQPASTIKAIFAHPGSPPNSAINRTASGSRLSLR